MPDLKIFMCLKCGIVHACQYGEYEKQFCFVCIFKTCKASQFENCSPVEPNVEELCEKCEKEEREKEERRKNGKV